MTKIFIVTVIMMLFSCASAERISNNVEWDFDHKVRFQQTQLEDGRYHLIVTPKSDTRFSKLATFLMRKSFEICRSYGFKMEILQGVELYNDRIAHPNFIMRSLAANIECPNNKA